MIVLDASAWIGMLLGDEPLPSPQERVLVPPHFDVECLGAVRALQQRGALTAAESTLALEIHLGSSHESVRDERDLRLAWTWREDLSLADAWYAALAHRLDAPWVTTDRRAMRTARRLGVTALRPA